MQLLPVNETEAVIQAPIVGVLLDPLLHKLRGCLGVSSALRRLLGQEDRPKFIGHDQLGVQGCGDLQERVEQLKLFRFQVMLTAEILHDASPVDIGQQTAVTKAEVLHRICRRNVQHLLQRSFAAKPVNHLGTRNAQHKADDQCEGRDDRNFVALAHLKLRRSKMMTAALKQTVAYSNAYSVL